MKTIVRPIKFVLLAFILGAFVGWYGFPTTELIVDIIGAIVGLSWLAIAILKSENSSSYVK